MPKYIIVSVNTPEGEHRLAIPTEVGNYVIDDDINSLYTTEARTLENGFHSFRKEQKPKVRVL